MTATQIWTTVFVGLTFALYLTIAWISRVRDTGGFYVAGRGVPSVANGMATASDWMSASSFIGMAGLISVMGYAGGVYLMGWTGGYVLLALLLAPYLRKFGHYTVPDFVGERFSSDAARVVSVLCALFICFVYVAGQMRGVGVVFSRFIGVDINIGVFIGMAIVFIYATLGGMKSITWTQVAQYWVLITAFLIVAIAIAIKLTGIPVPSLAMGATLRPEYAGGEQAVYLLERLNQIHADLGFASYTEPFIGSWDKVNVFFVTLAMMCGTAGLPHVIVRFYTVKTVRAARWSAMWALFFIAILYVTAPATAAFARYFMIESLNGATEATMPAWYESWRRTGLITWLDDGDGVVLHSNRDDNEIFRNGTLGEAEITEIRDAHGQWIASNGTAGADGRIRMRELGLSAPDNDIILLATPEMAELASWIIALVAAGGLAAALSTASGLLLVISSGVAHDLYYKVLKPDASDSQRLLVGRTVIGVAVVIAGLIGINPPGFVSEVVAFAFGLAASSLFPVLLMGIFSKRVGTIPAIAGMIVGITFTAFYIIAWRYFGMEPWSFGILENGINPQGVGVIGMLLNFAVTLALTPLFPAPSRAAQAMIDSVREPEGFGPAARIEQAIDH
jgi:cation/acetate symporter